MSSMTLQIMHPFHGIRAFRLLSRFELESLIHGSSPISVGEIN